VRQLKSKAEGRRGDGQTFILGVAVIRRPVHSRDQSTATEATTTSRNL
jgi:hypothetical protein